MVDIPNHEDPLRELSKTSMVNNVTLILCWSAAEAARYLELYKSYEHASFSAIRGQQASSYAERLVEFVTVPRGLNKADAVSLVSNFGSLKNAINAGPEQVEIIGGWGRVKVKRWCSAVEEPFRVKKTAKRSAKTGGDAPLNASRDSARLVTSQPSTVGTQPRRDVAAAGFSKQPAKPGQFQFYDPDLDNSDDEEAAMVAAAIEESKRTSQPTQHGSGGVGSSSGSGTRGGNELSEGVAAALARLRENG
jgi:DNA excision repair protein ERCC-1